MEKILEFAKRQWERIFIQTWFPFAIVLLIAMTIVLTCSIITWEGIRGYKDHFSDILCNMNGSIFDIAILGLFVALITAAQEKKKNIQRWKEEIDDFRGWNEPEAMFRIVGNIKRLLKNNVIKIDLNHCFLNNANLFDANLKSANLTGAYLEGAHLGGAHLEEALLMGAYLSGTDLTAAYITGANLAGAHLKGVRFRNFDFSSIISFYRAELDSRIFSQIKANWPEKLATKYTGGNWVVVNELLEMIKKPEWNGSEMQYDQSEYLLGFYLSEPNKIKRS